VRGIIARHDGFARVESTVGRGTCFFLHLPAEPTAVTPAPPPSSDALPCGAGESVLVVDDESEVRSLVQTALQRYGYRVRAVENGEEASRWLVDETFTRDLRIVVTDVMMPRLGGREVAELVRTRLPHVRVLVMSGLTTGGENHEEFGDAFLMKPFSHDCLLREVHALLHRSSS
jgi:DNA-binding response OmpR family regulator